MVGLYVDSGYQLSSKRKAAGCMRGRQRNVEEVEVFLGGRGEKRGKVARTWAWAAVVIK